MGTVTEARLLGSPRWAGSGVPRKEAGRAGKDGGGHDPVPGDGRLFLERQKDRSGGGCPRSTHAFPFHSLAASCLLPGFHFSPSGPFASDFWPLTFSLSVPSSLSLQTGRPLSWSFSVPPSMVPIPGCPPHPCVWANHFPLLKLKFSYQERTSGGIKGASERAGSGKCSILGVNYYYFSRHLLVSSILLVPARNFSFFH